MVSKVPLIKPAKANRTRNGFDLSQTKHFTAHAGMLLPVMCLDLISGDHVEIKAKDFMRTLPMNSAADLSMRGVYEFYFVPYPQVWAPFRQFVTSMKDYQSSVISKVHAGKAPLTVPYFDLDKAHTWSHDNIAAESSPLVDVFGYRLGLGAQRLFDLLGYGRKYNTTNVDYTTTSGGGRKHSFSNNLTFKCSALRLAAYQKIYQDYYLNSHYESRDVDAYSLDAYTGEIPTEGVTKLCTLRYRNARNDYYTNIRPSQMFNLSSLGYNSALNMGTDINGRPEMVTNNSSSVYLSSAEMEDSDDSNLTISVSSIRSAFAVDKLLSITMRAGKTYSDQIAAHYGVELPKSVDGRCTYLGGFDSNIGVSDIDQTSGTTQTGEYKHTGGYLGRTVGKGVGSGYGEVVCDTKEHGILMCIYSLVPAMQYDSTRLDPMVAKLGRFDFFTPEFENLGMQPLQAEFVSTLVDRAGKVLGYQPRYSEYKTALDINHGQFSTGDSLSHYTVGRFRVDVHFPDVGPSEFKIDPRWLDSVFVVGYNGYEITDCVYGGCHFNIVKVSNMSVDGMPRV